VLSNSTVYLCLVYLSSLRPVFQGLACAYVSMLGVTVASRAEFSMNLLNEYSSSFLRFLCSQFLVLVSFRLIEQRVSEEICPAHEAMNAKCAGRISSSAGWVGWSRKNTVLRTLVR